MFLHLTIHAEDFLRINSAALKISEPARLFFQGHKFMITSIWKALFSLKFEFFLKEQSNKIFDPQFFPSMESTCATATTSDQGVKMLYFFLFWLRFRRVIRIFRNIPGVSHPGNNSISPRYKTPASQSSRGIRPRVVIFP